MAKQVQTGSLALRVLIYFARNPDEELTSVDVAEKFGVDQREVHGRLSRAVRDGVFDRTCSSVGRGNACIYAAGDALLRMIGACMPVASVDLDAVGSLGQLGFPMTQPNGSATHGG